MNRGRNKKAEGRRVHMLFTEDTFAKANEMAEALGTSLTNIVTIAVRKMHRAEFGQSARRSNGANHAQVQR